jgi:predicted ATPase
LVQKYEFVQHETWSRYLHGWARSASEGLSMVIQMERAVSDFQATGGETRLSRFLGLIAARYFELAQVEKAEATWAEAMSKMEQHLEYFWAAELYRLKGEMILKQGSGRQWKAETWLQRALETAHSQQAKSLELRAAASLSRLWQQQGRYAQAHRLLSQVYDWFTEGFTTPDLQEAKALLDQLANPAH